MYKFHIFLYSLVMWFPSVGFSVSFQEFDSIQTEEGVKDKVVVELTYKFISYRYEPPYPITYLQRGEEGKYNSPIDTITTYFSAMRNGDYNLFMSCWDEVSKIEVQKMDKEAGREPQFWIDKWEKWIGGRDLYIDYRVNTGSYILLKYRLTDNKQEKISTNTIAFKKEGEHWFVTSELSADPVLVYWDKELKKIGRDVR